MACVVNPDGTISCPEPETVALVKAMGAGNGATGDKTADDLTNALRASTNAGAGGKVVVVLDAATVRYALDQLANQRA